MARHSDFMKRELFLPEGANVYAILDGAAIPALLVQLHGEQAPAHFECLLPGTLTPDMLEVAPYLVQLEPDAPFTDWLLEAGWGQHWGIFALSPLDFQSVRYHFRSLVRVYDEAGKRYLFFRYYDPRVLRIFLPTCREHQLAEMFGPVDLYLAESESATELLSYRLEEGALAAGKVVVPAAG
ncbi:DUF4123 domain-containing protein [Parasulfuritortus cantonensis]|uniref:DUF4123 domain-containing protein n=1 Tax=Parasulfuritortus cantonensis TaxID=2528202 RepID=A0A4R1BT38_9PROT|nr:DUF4123 domain-containing protein [Parasulfuritortus cantonensis]TCJ20405.1 DUF4123 domain-containing protein [Parasulfuritortus cantonensis]